MYIVLCYFVIDSNASASAASPITVIPYESSSHTPVILPSRWIGKHYISKPTFEHTFKLLKDKTALFNAADSTHLYMSILDYKPVRLSRFEYAYGSYGIYKCLYDRMTRIRCLSQNGALSEGWNRYERQKK